jgi:FkbM family methyltransferase
MLGQIWKTLRNARHAPEIFRCAAETPQWASVTAAYLGLSQPRYPFPLRLRHETAIPIEEFTDLKTFWQIYLRRVYRVSAKDRVIVDLGANIGLFTLYAARCAPDANILAVEPFPSTFSRLVANIRDRKLEDRVVCANFAASGTNGSRLMAAAAVSSQRNALAPSSPASAAISGIRVAAKTLEAILDENKLAQVDLLKVDIEGSEYEVVLSSSQNVLGRIRRIALEYHGDCAPYCKQQLFDHLRDARFAVASDLCDAQGYGVTEMIR